MTPQWWDTSLGNYPCNYSNLVYYLPPAAVTVEIIDNRGLKKNFLLKRPQNKGFFQFMYFDVLSQNSMSIFIGRNRKLSTIRENKTSGLSEVSSAGWLYIYLTTHDRQMTTYAIAAAAEITLTGM